MSVRLQAQLTKPFNWTAVLKHGRGFIDQAMSHFAKPGCDVPSFSLLVVVSHQRLVTYSLTHLLIIYTAYLVQGHGGPQACTR